MKKLIVVVLVMVPSLCWSSCTEMQLQEIADRQIKVVCLAGEKPEDMYPDNFQRWGFTEKEWKLFMKERQRLTDLKQDFWLTDEQRQYREEAELKSKEIMKEEAAAYEMRKQKRADEERMKLEPAHDGQVFRNLDGTPAGR